MGFLKEDVPEAGPSALAEEHWRLVNWMKTQRVGVIGYLGHRMVDSDVPAALYYIQGIGMGHGQRFALVLRDDIYVVSVSLAGKKRASDVPARVVNEVSVPEFAALGREAIQGLLAEALGAYYEVNSHMRLMTFGSYADARDFDWTAARWTVRPKKHSMLYWRTELAGRWQSLRIRWWPPIRDVACSPLVGATALAAFSLAGAHLPTVLAGIWLAWRLLKYESHWRLGPWMIGKKKLVDPMFTFQIMGRLADPRPLAALRVRVERVDGEPMVRRVRLINQSFTPARFVSINAASLADLLAPGLTQAMRRESLEGALNLKEIESRFPSMTTKWVWPRSSFTSRHTLSSDFPMRAHARQIKAMALVPRILSGEPRRGPNSFLLRVEIEE